MSSGTVQIDNVIQYAVWRFQVKLDDGRTISGEVRKTGSDAAWFSVLTFAPGKDPLADVPETS